MGAVCPSVTKPRGAPEMQPPSGTGPTARSFLLHGGTGGSFGDGDALEAQAV